MYLERGCPVCRSNRNTVEVSSRPTAEECDWDMLKKAWAGFFREKPFFSYCRCDSCGLLYCGSYFTDAQLAELYSDMADNTAGLGAERTNKTQSEYASLIKDDSADGDFLELGPDIGLFTNAYARRFDPAAEKTYWLFEPNIKVHSALASRMEGYRVAIRTELHDFHGIADASVGAAVMIHVLDHLLNPLAMLIDLRKKMKSGTVAHIVTHNEQSVLARVLRQRWPGYCLQHPQLYSPRTIAELLDRAGFSVIRSQRTTNYFPASYLLRHGLYALKINARFLADKYFLPVGVQLGNILTSARARA